MKVSKQGILQSGLIEADGNAKVYGDDVVVGENLIQNTIALTDYSPWSKWGQTSTNEIVNNKFHFIKPADSYGGIRQVCSISPNTAYTCSLTAYGQGTLIIWNHYRSTQGGNNLIQYNKTYALTEYPQRFIFTFPAYSNSTYLVDRFNLMIGLNGEAGEVYIDKIKLEEGDAATPWVPNSADPIYATYDFANKDKSIPAPIQANEFYEI